LIVSRSSIAWGALIRSSCKSPRLQIRYAAEFVHPTGSIHAPARLAWGARTRSSCCGEFVFVDQTAEQITPVHLEWVRRRGRCDRWTDRRVGRSQVECAVRSSGVVVRDVDAEDVLKLAAADDQ